MQLCIKSTKITNTQNMHHFNALKIHRFPRGLVSVFHRQNSAHMQTASKTKLQESGTKLKEIIFTSACIQ